MDLISSLRLNVFQRIDTWRTGSPRLRYWKHLERSQYLPAETLKRIQWERLTNILRYAYENNRFYRERFKTAGIKPEDIRTEADFRALPLTRKEDVRNGYSEILSSGYPMKDLLQFKTGGSTGKSLELYISEECSELRNACAMRHDRWSGWEPGEPIGALWGNPKLPHGLKNKLKNTLISPKIYLDTMAVTEESVNTFSRQWSRAKPTLLFGHAHSIYLLARYVREGNIQTIRPKAIISTSMMLLQHEREYIEDVFRVKVFDRYGCEEVGLIASECEQHSGLHMNIEHNYIEFLDETGQPVSPGQEGKIVLTDLMNRAMPFIRYVVEDVGIPSARFCSCARQMPLMECVTGRVADFLVKADGTRVAGVSLIENTLTKIPGIAQMQIIQDSLATINVNIVTDGTFSHQTQDDLRSYFHSVFGQEVQILINLVDRINQEPSGKYTFSLCRFSHLYPHVISLP